MIESQRSFVFCAITVSLSVAATWLCVNQTGKVELAWIDVTSVSGFNVYRGHLVCRADRLVHCPCQTFAGVSRTPRTPITGGGAGDAHVAGPRSVLHCRSPTQRAEKADSRSVYIQLLNYAFSERR